MTDTAIVGVVSAIGAQVLLIIAALFSGWAALQARAEAKSGRLEAQAANVEGGRKADTLIEKATEIHTLANSSLSKATSALEVANVTIQGLHNLIALSEQAKRETAIAHATILRAAQEAPAVPAGLLGPPEVLPISAPTEATILLVEDSADDVELFRRAVRTITSTTFHVVPMGTLTAALDYLQRAVGPVDIGVVDLGLPDAHGLDAIVALHAVAPALPLIVLSGAVDDKVVAQAFQVGAQDVVLKGASTSLLRVLAYAMERQRYVARRTEGATTR